MLPTKFQGHRPFGSREENVLRLTEAEGEFGIRKTALSHPSPGMLILTVLMRYFCGGSLLLFVLAVRIYTLVRLLC